MMKRINKLLYRIGLFVWKTWLRNHGLEPFCEEFVDEKRRNKKGPAFIAGPYETFRQLFERCQPRGLWGHRRSQN